jgi:phage protein D
MTSGWFSVEFPKSDIQGRPQWASLEILQDVEKHDACVVTFNSYRPHYENSMSPGTPVVIKYGTRGQSSTFIGNIAKISPVSKTGSSYTHTITVVAASRQFRVTARNTWRNKTCPEVVQSIGAKLGFKVVTKQHSLRRKVVTQSGGSYWSLLNDLARFCGYALRVEGTTLYFLPIPDMVKLFRTSAPKVSYAASSKSARIARFTPVMGNTSDDSDDLADAANVVAFGPGDTGFVDVTEYPVSAIRTRKKYSPPYERSSPNIVAYTREEARAIARGMADRGAMAFDAELSCSGSPGLAPYHPVYVDSGNASSSGWWIVKSVRHCFEDKKYTCEAIVSSDEVSQQFSYAPNDVPIRDIYTEREYGLGIDGSILFLPEDPVVRGNTFTPDSQFSEWRSTSPGTVLSTNLDLLTPPESVSSYPSTSTFPGPSLYPSI